MAYTDLKINRIDLVSPKEDSYIAGSVRQDGKHFPRYRIYANYPDNWKFLYTDIEVPDMDNWWQTSGNMWK